MSEFFENAELFGIAWATMLLAAVALAWPGTLVLARGQILLAIAAGQTAACGAAAAMMLIGLAGGAHIHGDPRIHFGALLGGLIGTAIAWRTTAEYSAWLFVVGSVGTVLCVAQSPYGMADVLALQHSNALSASILESNIFLFFVLVIGVFILLKHRELRLIAIDPVQAAACGLHVKRWNLFIGIAIGILISLAVSSLGLLYTFGCLILPGLVGGQLVKTFWALFIIVPFIAVIGSLSGIYFGHSWDTPPGQTAVLVLALAYPIALIFKKTILQKF